MQGKHLHTRICRVTMMISLFFIVAVLQLHPSSSFQRIPFCDDLWQTPMLGSQEAFRSRSINTQLFADPNKNESPVEEYKNAPTKFLSNFMGSDSPSMSSDTINNNPIDSIDFNAPKFKKVELETLAAILDYELTKKEWFVTGNVNPIYFSDDFEFQDPDVKLSGIEDYARGVFKLFDQETARAEIISSLRNEIVPNTITVTWRLSGRVNIGPGLTIKPYICYTDFTVDETTGLITMQEDRFDIPQWDILLSALFPFLAGKITAAPAPPVEPREVSMPKLTKESTKLETNLFTNWFSNFGKQ